MAGRDAYLHMLAGKASTGTGAETDADEPLTMAARYGVLGDRLP